MIAGKLISICGPSGPSGMLMAPLHEYAHILLWPWSPHLQDRSFTFILKTPPTAVLLKKAAGELSVGVSSPNAAVVPAGQLLCHCQCLSHQWRARFCTARQSLQSSLPGSEKPAKALSSRHKHAAMYCDGTCCSNHCYLDTSWDTGLIVHGQMCSRP